MQTYENLTGLFMIKNDQTQLITSMIDHGCDLFKRRQIALNCGYPISWDGHKSWDRFSALIFDIHGFIQPVDGTLDLGHTQDGEELRFDRTYIDLREFRFTAQNCMSLYLKHLSDREELELLTHDSEPFKEWLFKGEQEREGYLKDITEIVNQIGFVKRIN